MFKTLNSHIFRYNGGVIIALICISSWFLLLTFILNLSFGWTDPWVYLLALVQTHLYTGLFITAHDAMHGTVSNKSKVNDSLGRIASLFFAFNHYPRLKRNHHRHHRAPGNPDDPDVHRQPFFIWYVKFLRQYITWWQVVLMAIAYNVLAYFFPERNVVLFWMIPALLSTLQLFYFGTYLPHRRKYGELNEHSSGSQGKNHLWAFVSCYFFGYHYEHHASPSTPWWLLYKQKT